MYARSLRKVVSFPSFVSLTCKFFLHGGTLNNVKPVIQLIWKFIQLIQTRISCIRSAYTAVS